MRHEEPYKSKLWYMGLIGTWKVGACYWRRCRAGGGRKGPFWQEGRSKGGSRKQWKGELSEGREGEAEEKKGRRGKATACKGEKVVALMVMGDGDGVVRMG